MKILTTIVAVLFFLAGLVFCLQGLGVLPGSFMSGQIQWAVYGGLMMLLSAGGLIWLYRSKPKLTPPDDPSIGH